MLVFGKRFGSRKYRSPDNGDGDSGTAAIAAALAAKEAADKAAAAAAADEATKAAEAAAAAKAAADASANKPSDEEARLLKENMKKKEDLRKAQEDLAAAAAKLKEFEGIDAAAVKKMLADAKTAEDKQLEAQGDWERLKTRMAEEHTKEIATFKTQLEEMQNQLKSANGTVNELSIGSLFGQSQFITDELTLTPAKARVIYSDHFDLEDGKVVGYDKPRGDKGRTAIVDAYGNAVPFDAAMKRIVEADPEKDHLFKSKLKPGASSDSKKIESKSQQSDDKSSLDKISAGMKALNIPVS